MYLTLKALHIISLVAWFAGIFYIWRLFVYHAETNSEEVKKTLAIMEEKLYRIIMNPAMIATILFGSLLFYLQWNSFSSMIWIWTKISLVVLLIGLQHLANRYRKRLLLGEKFNSKQFRILNEVPTLLLFLIVFLVVFKSC